MWAVFLKGFALGWSVAWPPGPINAEMLRRGLARRFLSAWCVGLGACTGDFLWALGVSLGAGAAISVPGVRVTLGALSVALLLFLAWSFARGAARAWRERGSEVPARRLDSAQGGYALGLTLALTSPFNIAFWLAAVGSLAAENQVSPGASLVLAAAVISGAVLWDTVFCTAIMLGARFATPAWHVVTQGATAAMMLAFAVRAVVRLANG